MQDYKASIEPPVSIKESYNRYRHWTDGMNTASSLMPEIKPAESDMQSW